MGDEAERGGYVDLLRHQITLARFGELALRSDDLNEILTEACRLAGDALGTDLAKVVELQEDGKTLVVRAGVGWKPGVVGVATITAEDDTSEGHALRTGEPMISPDIATETRFKYSQFLIDNNVRAIANVVIIGGQGRPPFGILQIDSHVPRQFTESDTLFLRSYANLLAAAVDRLRLRRALEETVAERTRELTAANARLQAEAEERERIEDTLRQSLKMEAVGQLTGGLAHDFNNLLASISGNLELMRIRTDQGRTAEIDRYIEVAMTSVNRAAALTHRLLAFSRRQTLDPKPTNVNRLVSDMEELFVRTAGPGIEVEIKLASDLWPALCDPNQLENAMLNLVINARDAMPNGGHLLIETANSVFPDWRGVSQGEPPGKVPAGEYMGLFVTDTGMGMSPDVIARAFDPFFTTKPTGEGTGLGLSMIYGFVQQSGGYVLLSSEEGQGTMVSIYLPRHFGTVIGREGNRRRGQADPCGGGRGGAVSRGRACPADGHRRDALGSRLHGAGGRKQPVRPANRGVQRPHRSPPNRCRLARGYEWAAARRCRAGAASRPQGLFLTGYAESVAAGNGRMEQGMEIMTKPFALDKLVAKVKGMISG